MEAVSTCTPTSPTGPVTHSQSLPEYLTLSNPSGATTDVAQSTSYLLSTPQYTLSYQHERGVPNWVNWHLSTD